MLIIKVPGINGFGKTKGCRNAGNAILECLGDVYSNEQGKIIDKNVLDLEEIHVDNDNLDEQEKLIYENCLKIFESKDKIVFLGGDHSISFPIGKAFFEHCKKNGEKACLIVFDSHADCMKPGKNPNHEEWLRALIEYGFNKENVLLVGSRNNDIEEIKFLAQNKIKQINMNELNNNLEEVTDVIMEFASGKQLYISFDIDAVDLAFAPSTSYPETAGLTSRQVVYIVSRMSKMKNLRAFDIVEVDSEKDLKKDKRTIKLASKILAELL